MKTVTFYTKPSCGLCDEAMDVIETAGVLRQFKLEIRNILDDLSDYERYKHDIPVILVDGREIARHRLDPSLFERELAMDSRVG